VKKLHSAVSRTRALGLSYRGTFIILALNICAILFEGFGLAMLLPIFEYIEKSGNLELLAQAGKHWSLLIDVSNYLSVPITLPILLLLSFSAILLRQMFVYLRVSYNSKLLFESIHQLRKTSFELSLNAHTDLQQDAILGKAVNDVAIEFPRAMNALYGTVHFASRILLILFYLGGMMLLAPWMTVTSVGVLLVTGLMLVGLIRRSRATSTVIVEANREFAAFLVERLSSLRLIRLSGTEQAELKNLSTLSERQRDNEIRLRELSAGLDALVEPIAVLIGFVVLYLGFAHFNMPIGILGLFMIVMMRMLPVTKEALGSFQSIMSQWESLTIVDERMQLIKAQRESKGGDEVFRQIADRISFKDVSYTYKAGTPALKGISCEINAGQMTALVGPSGSGKSTFIDLLPRLRQPDSGEILIDDTPLEEFSVASLRAGIAFVPQSPQIFNVTAREYIRYGGKDASDADVCEAARLAGADTFIETLTMGYETELGENGKRLSGGQRQRLDIARALVRNSPILIFDEPTSQLDADSEQLFRETLQRVRRETNCLIILVGHRLTTVADADQILVFEDGVISDMGSHAQLIRKGGWYARAIGKQSFQKDGAQGESDLSVAEAGHV